MKALVEIFLQPGKVLILTGPQGCGKSTLARKIATNLGHFVEVQADELAGHFALWRILTACPRAMIVDGLPESRGEAIAVNALATQRTLVCERPMSAPVMLATPGAIIICAEAHETERARQIARAQPELFHVVDLE